MCRFPKINTLQHHMEYVYKEVKPREQIANLTLDLLRWLHVEAARGFD